MLWFRVRVSPINREGEPVEISWEQIRWNSTVLDVPGGQRFFRLKSTVSGTSATKTQPAACVPRTPPQTIAPAPGPLS